MTYKYNPPSGHVAETRRDIKTEFARWNQQAGLMVVTDYDLPYANAGLREAEVVFLSEAEGAATTTLKVCQVCEGRNNDEPSTLRYQPAGSPLLLCWPCARGLSAYAQSFGEPVSVRWQRWMRMVRGGTGESV